MGDFFSARRRFSCSIAVTFTLTIFLITVLSSSAMAVSAKWTRTYGSADNQSDEGYGVAIGPDGSVYVTGYTYVAGQNNNIWLRKYSPRGRVKWTRMYDGDDNEDDVGYGVAVGPDGSVYVTGYTYVAGQQYNIWLRKYSPRGEVKWTRTYNGGDNSDDEGRSVAIGTDGSVYVTGYTYVAGQNNNIWLRKYSPRGRIKWTRTYNGGDNVVDQGYGVAVGPDGSVYVTGFTSVAGQGDNTWLRKYSPRGRIKWTRTYNGDDNLEDIGRSVAAGPDGSVYITGYTWTSEQYYNIFLRKYSPRGRVKWTRTFNGTDNQNDQGYGVAVGPDGSVYVTGFTWAAGQGDNTWLRKYSPLGRAKWTMLYNGADNSDDEGYGVAIGPDGSIYVTGYTDVIGQNYNIWLMKYR